MAEQLKKIFFTQDSMNAMADIMKRFYPPFDKERFLELIHYPGWEALELKAKMRHTTQCLHHTLPPSYMQAVAILKEAAPYVKGFEAMSLPDFVELYGMEEEWDLSFQALEVFTGYSSSEFAVRPFLDRDPKKALGYMLAFATNENPRVRRLASEGCRPRLPWAMALPKFKKDPAPILPILEKLKNDPSEDVRRSVANNLNDISKDNPELLLDISEKWYGHNKNTDAIIKHACRSMMKAGNKRAMKFFGFGTTTQMNVENLKLDQEILAIGEPLTFSFDLILTEKTESNVRLEYGLYFMKANGKLSKKVFKITENTYLPGTHPFKRKHSFQDYSTRKHYPGQHKISIIINGEELAEMSFTLNLPR